MEGASREEAEGKPHTLLSSMLFNQFLTMAPEHTYVLHHLSIIFKHTEIHMCLNRHLGPNAQTLNRQKRLSRKFRL